MPAEKPIMLGIDLGTTNTCVAYVRNKVARVVPSDKGSLILPSVVAMSAKGDMLVGNVAKDQMVVNPRNTIYGAKRLIGRQYNAKVVQDIKHDFSSVLVYDLGGGTFDVSVLQLHGNVMEVLATGGDTFLGGVDFDNRIIDFVLEEFRNQTKIDLTQSPIAMQRIKNAAEAAKIDLSLLSNVVIELPYIADRKGKPVDLRIPLSRERVNALVMDLVDKTFQLVERVLGEKSLNRGDIQEVLLVGGQTRMPLVQGKAHQFFGKPPGKGVHPDESVALGAALLAESMSEIDSVTLVDALSMHIGFAMRGRRCRKVFENDPH